MEAYLLLVIHLVSGAIGGNLTGRFFDRISLGIFWNLTLGLLGGGIAALCMIALGLETASAPDIPDILKGIAAGIIGGSIVLTFFGGLLRTAIK